MYLAVLRGPAAVALLLEFGADPTVCGDSGRAPLHAAAYRSAFGPNAGSLEISWALLAAGADVNALSAKGQTPLDEADCQCGCRACRADAGYLAFLREKGGRPAAELG